MASACAVPFPADPTGVSSSGLTLDARVYTSFGGDVTYWFRYGTTSSNGSETPHRTVQMTADSSRAVSEPIAITAGNEYHWQVCSQDQEEDPPRPICSGDHSLYVGPVSCNPITRNTWATNDLSTCAPSIGAPNITLNLQGHSFGGYIENPGFDDVTIEGGTAFGVRLNDARDNRLRRMTLTGGFISPNSPQNAIVVAGDSGGTLIADNEAFSGPVTLDVDASGVRVLRNTVSGAGMTSSDKEAPLVVHGDDNLIEGNTATLNSIGGGRGVGRASILVFGDNNELIGNVANDGLVYGILIWGGTTGTVLIGNTANNNGFEFSFGSGIAVEAASASLGDNTTDGNKQLGIDAPSTVTDLGGNHAQGNGDARQCTGVVCQP